MTLILRLSGIALIALSGCVSTPLGERTRAESDGTRKVAVEQLDPVLPGPGARPGASEQPPLPSLPQVISQNLNGAAEDEPGQRAAIQKFLEQYLKYRKSHDQAERAEIAAPCQDTAAVNPFCALMISESRLKKSQASRSGRRRFSAASRQLVQDFLHHRLSALNAASEEDLKPALKQISDFTRVQPLAEELVKSEICPSGSLLTAMGMRAEERFPDPALRSLSMALYRKAMDCSNDAIKAAYRLGLLKIWEGKLEEADQALGRIIDHPDAVDFRSRVIYWRTYCAHELKNIEAEKLLKDRLIREFPLSLHGLLTGDGTALSELTILNSQEPFIRYRSLTRPELNPIVAAAEALQTVELPEASYTVLATQLDHLKGAETPFQMYIAVLLMRSGELIRKFQLITSLYHEHPDLIAKSTLQMLYPLRNFSIVQRHESQMDPFLVLALIRQESAFNEHARSRADARGLMQLLPSTARRLERINKKQLYDPTVNVRIGVKYFNILLSRYNGDTELALAAYNAGAEKVDEWIRRYPVENRLLFMDLIPFRETREYVASIARNYYWYLRLYEVNKLKQTSILNLRRTTAGARRFSVFNLFQRMGRS